MYVSQLRELADSLADNAAILVLDTQQIVYVVISFVYWKALPSTHAVGNVGVFALVGKDGVS
jgi:hypothetical protein